MNKQFKKIIIMFVMVLALMGIGAIQNGTIANAATVGEQLLQPEEGWTRYENDNSAISYYGTIGELKAENFSGGSAHQTGYDSYSEIKFNFTKNKIALIYRAYNYGKNPTISIDGNDPEEIMAKNYDGFCILVYNTNSLDDKEHSVVIKTNTSHVFDAIDIDKDGILLPYNEEIKNQSISLDKSSLTLKENNTKNLIATTTPSALDLEWSSSEDTIATVDENGKVTGIKEGTCIITAQIKGTDVKATCEVTVTKEDIVEPEEPSIENGSLYIEMIDGNIKRADKSQIEKFKKWFISRDLDETESPIFKITNAKGNVEYLVHDKVVGFEIRE